MKQRLFILFVTLILGSVSIFIPAQLLWAETPTGGDEISERGYLVSRPDGSTNGEWVMDGLTVIADINTDIDEEDGPLEIGVCAEFRYVIDGNINRATRIRSRLEVDCAETLPTFRETDGYIEAFPENLIGIWIINGTTYTSTSETEFDLEHGNFALGACVEVEYDQETFNAYEISTEAEFECQFPDNGEDGVTIYGVLDVFPPNLIGEWVVDGVAYTATTSTQFDQDDGPFFVGGCVEVEHIPNTTQAIEISTEDDNCGDEAEQNLYGLVEQMPTDGLQGEWIIGGQTFSTTASTEFDQEDGLLMVGECAEVEYVTAVNTLIATKIQTEDPYECNGGTYTNQAHGIVNSFPISYYGAWVISDVIYVASSQTSFNQDDGAFDAGACVEVSYLTVDGLNQAVHIETEEAGDCTGNDADDDNFTTDPIHKLYAPIEQFPPAPFTGTWQLAQTNFLANNNTQFDQDEQPFAMGVCVEAGYTIISGTRTLATVESKIADECANGLKAYGVIEQFPANMTGTWQISTLEYEVISSTELVEEFGAFALGAYVEVEFEIVDGLLVASKIETHVAPGAGRTNIIGTLESQNNGQWTVDGTTYTADRAILISQNPQIGQPVQLNLYQQAGQTFVTRATGLGTYQIFLPVITKN